ncbi:MULTISPECIES: LysE family translocator [Pantoea]|jgi:threonine/homoserine/homoserine lactone efflux protein|uniref:LysE family translocator n=1 Tax=Pantoea TaxID=53335 RepID=UPI00057E51B7|nr:MULTISPECIES: LysE family translocator [Pantoea]AWP34964.1 LysE family translocator [Pantoea vagans]MCD2357341.1 LysE family translocator [Pantoea sp. MHSD4]MDJ0475192.1 LysE family translocator [Pantoea eucalypti]PQL27825.1 LysE family translocator [Pantoea ananatis]
MPDHTHFIAFGLIALAMVLTPGPNMIYLISRSVCQGRQAGLISLGGIAFAFVLYILCAALGITAFLFAIPYAYDLLRFSGVAYLLYLAWQSVKPGGRSTFAVTNLPIDSSKKLFIMGFITNVLNPKVAIMYLSLLPQFIQPEHGSVLTQSLELGSIQISISMVVNATIVMMAGTLAKFLSSRPAWLKAQRWIMGTVLAGLAVRIALESKK